MKRKYEISEEMKELRNQKISLSKRKKNNKAYLDDFERIHILVPKGIKEILKSLNYKESQILDMIILNKIDPETLKSIIDIYTNTTTTPIESV